VLAPDRKQLIHAMVKHSEGVFKDIISGKGGGSIFLLHGVRVNTIDLTNI
jgi:hypothetical protein